MSFPVRGQVSYTQNPLRGLRGQRQADGSPIILASYNGDTTPIVFGHLVKRGTLVAGPPSNPPPALNIAGLGDIPWGIATYKRPYDKLYELDTATGGVLPNVEVQVFRRGNIILEIDATGVTIAPGDRGYARAVTGAGGTVLGAFRNTEVSGQTIDTSQQIEFKSESFQVFEGVLGAWAYVDMSRKVSGQGSVADQEIITGGATPIDVNVPTTRADATAANITSTMPDGTFNGQQKLLVLTLAGGHTWVVTVTDMVDGATHIITFTTAGDNMLLQWNASLGKWFFVSGTYGRIA